MSRNMDGVDVEVNGTQTELMPMPTTIPVAVHTSQFPDRVQADLRDSLRTRRLNHKFLYDSPRQTRKWLALHQAYSPSRTDPDCAATYDRAFQEAIRLLPPGPVHLVGLGCGGGQKDARLLQWLQNTGHSARYTPADVSVSMVLVAAQAAQSVLAPEQCFPLVCDLATATDLAPELARRETGPSRRLVTFFGMIPNFEPQLILDRLATLLRPDDFLLFSANLAPGPDYEAGVKRILPLYDNQLTREWLLAFLIEMGVDSGDGEVRFETDSDAVTGLKRVIAHFHFQRNGTIEAGEERFDFRAGDRLQLFFSYRHTPERVREMLAKHRMRVLNQWVTQSGEEGVFLVSYEV